VLTTPGWDDRSEGRATIVHFRENVPFAGSIAVHKSKTDGSLKTGFFGKIVLNRRTLPFSSKADRNVNFWRWLRTAFD